MDAPSKYDSIRPSGEEGRLSAQKRKGLTQAAEGVATAPAYAAIETTMGGRDAVEALTKAPARLLKSVTESADSIGGGVKQYKKASQDEAKLDRELNSQTKRETRGMKRGGRVKKMATGGSVKAKPQRVTGYRGYGIAKKV
jgi:hypothetical protein